MKIINDKIDFDTLKKLTPPDAHHIRDIGYYTDRVEKAMFEQTQQRVTELPWDKAKGRFDLREGELTIWAGVNGMGKSMVTTQLALFAAKTSSWCIASMEMKPEATIERMVEMAVGSSSVTKRALHELVAMVGQNIMLYDKQDTVDYQHMLKVVRYVREVYKVDHFVIDSLMKCDKRGASKENKTVAQVDFINDLASYARDSGLHVHLVHHMRKGERESNLPDKFDVRGAGEIVDMADNLVIVHSLKSDDPFAEPTDLPDRFLKIAKQRHGKFEGKLNLYQSHGLQWVESPSRRPMVFFQPVQLPNYAGGATLGI